MIIFQTDRHTWDTHTHGRLVVISSLLCMRSDILYVTRKDGKKVPRSFCQTRKNIYIEIFLIKGKRFLFAFFAAVVERIGFEVESTVLRHPLN